MKDGVNGGDVNRLQAGVDGVKGDPDSGRITFQGTTVWEKGAYSRTRIREFNVEGDEPQSLLGSNRAPNSVEAVLAALGSCLAVGVAYNAAARGVEMQSMEIEIRGDQDLRGFLWIDEEVRPGLQNVRVNYRIRSDAPQGMVEEVTQNAEQTSPQTSSATLSADHPARRVYSDPDGSQKGAQRRRGGAAVR